MARKEVERSLPDLDTLFGAFPGFNPKVSRQATLARELRRAAESLRKEDACPFYAMRAIGEYFNVPIRTVSMAYEELELEGILNRIRGSKTMLAGRTQSPRKPVRALIGIPVWFHALIVSPYCRNLNWELEERLRSYGYVADIIFFRGNEINRPEFTDRLLKHNLDYVIWHTPHPKISQVLLSLKDNGVHQVIVQPTDNPISLELPTYFQNWQSAYVEMATNWYRNGIRKVLVPEPIYLPSIKAMKQFATTLNTYELEVQFVQATPQELMELALSMPAEKTAVAFLDQLGADEYCNREPVCLEAILKHCRVGFCRGPLRIPYFETRDHKADVIRFSARKTAQRIAEGIRDDVLGKSPDHTFHAMYEADVPLSRKTGEL
ncbi:MAG: hypothetical protein ACQKBT_03395 [Puniceicoccales bacterium]